MRMGRFSGAALPLLLLALSLGCAGCSGKKEAPAGAPGAGGQGAAPKRPPVPVLTAVAQSSDVPVELVANGTVEAVQSAPVRAQVGGVVTAVNFREGEAVKAGQVLFELDARPFEAVLRQLEADRDRYTAQVGAAEAQLRALEAQAQTVASQARAAQSTAQAAEAQADLAATQAGRYAALLEKGFVTREQADQTRTAAEAAKAALAASRSTAEAAQTSSESTRSSIEAARAAVAAAKAARAASEAGIENAKVQLSYTKVRSPVSGLAGSLFTKLGDLVKANADTSMVVVNQISPILVKFSLPEFEFPRLQKFRKEGTLTVKVDLPGGGEREGRLVFVDNLVDRSTGTIAAKARFENPDQALWPGQFVNARLTLYVRRNAVTVPPAAIQVGQKGPYVYVVDAEGAAQLRPVKPGLATPALLVLEEGVSAGETVVVDGQLKLTPGAKTAPKTSLSAPAAPAQGAGR